MTTDIQATIRHFQEVLDRFDTAMLVSHSARGIHSRPMRLAQVNLADAGTIWFVTSRETFVVEELHEDRHLNVTLQGEQDYLSLAGAGELHAAATKIHELWNESWRTWFPEGPDDSRIVLIRFHAQQGDYWDASSWKRVSVAF